MKKKGEKEKERETECFDLFSFSTLRSRVCVFRCLFDFYKRKVKVSFQSSLLIFYLPEGKARERRFRKISERKEEEKEAAASSFFHFSKNLERPTTLDAE